VGEDGPTHQPVEQEAQIRLLEKLHNHSGRASFIALRPADSAETVAAWKYALNNAHTPTGLILSRQNITDVPPTNGIARIDASLKGLHKGAYVIQEAKGKADVILLASGSEVSTLVGGAKLLKERKNLDCRIVSVPSEGLFRAQEAAYQNEMLPADTARFGLTAGLSVTLEGLVAEKGKVFGLNHFGHSAPAGVLDVKLGYTDENVYKQVVEMLGI
jgi:transketolase